MSVGSFASGIPLIGEFADNSDEQAMAKLAQASGDWQSLTPPQFQKYTPEAYTEAGTYTPEMAKAQTVAEDPATREAQMGALNTMAGLAKTGLSDVDQAGYTQASNLGNQIAKQQSDAAMQNAAARGVGGSGMEFAMREAAAQGGAQRGQEAGLQQAADSARQRALYNQAYMGAAGQVRGQDFSNNAANADILNRFNMYNTGNSNQAQQGNLQNRQSLMNMNTGERNNAQQYNNNLEMQRYNAALGKTQGETGAYGNEAKGFAAENAARTDQRNKNTKMAAQMIGGVGGFGGAS